MKKITGFIQQQPKRSLAIGGTIIVLLVGFFVFHSLHKANATTRPARAKGEQVSVATVGSLSPDNATLSVIGKVVSQNDATILSETSGEIVSLNYKLGDSVSAGDIIATMENSSQRASVAQAQGSYDAAEANLNKTSGTTAENSTVTSNEASETVQNAQASVLANLQSTYAALDDAVHTKADVFFVNPRDGATTFSGTLTQYDSQLANDIQTERNELEPELVSANTISNDTNSADIDANIATMLQTAQSTETFLNNLIKMINGQIPNQNLSATAISADQTSISAARTEVVNAVTALTTIRSTYDTDLGSATTANNSASTGSESDIAVSQANVQTALGLLDAAKSALDKTIIRSPISGTIINLPITSGDYVPSFNTVAEVSNPSNLKIVGYVTGNDAQTLSVGSKAMIQDTVPGIITSVAPAINPQTGTIEVDIQPQGDQSSLLDGDSVTVDLDRKVSNTQTNSTASIIIPIVALKITPTGPVVFIVNSKTQTVSSLPVSIGSILGENIVITKGLTPDMQIVTDARGLTDGEIVSVKKP